MKYPRPLSPLLIDFTEAVDYTKFWNELRESLSLVKSGKFTAGAASFNHLAGGYDAGTSTCPRGSFTLTHWRISGYYGYMYSLVFAADMYATIFKADPLDPVRGDKYRRCILKPGSSREELDSLEVSRILLPTTDTYRAIGIPRSATQCGCVH